ncbi:MAG TPA: hypothetical protein DEG43_13655 [Acidimicrobiaceae bacterium]|jgi:hypothetical protein|nr:hypothetical protein [Acidimicrobiaceae bacterium]
MRWAGSLLNTAPANVEIQNAQRLLAAMRIGRTLNLNGLQVVVSEASELTWIGVDGSHHHGSELMEKIWRHVLTFETSANLAHILDRLWAGVDSELGSRLLLEEFNSLGHIKRSPAGVWKTQLMGETRVIGKPLWE